MTSIKPHLALFTESWLDSLTPDESVNIPGYSILRHDRPTRGGGILCYVAENYVARLNDFASVPAIPKYESEILSFYIYSLSLLVICVYHPFWNDDKRNKSCLETYVGILDYSLVYGPIDPSKLCVILHYMRTSTD